MCPVDDGVRGHMVDVHHIQIEDHALPDYPGDTIHIDVLDSLRRDMVSGEDNSVLMWFFIGILWTGGYQLSWSGERGRSRVRGR